MRFLVACVFVVGLAVPGYAKPKESPKKDSQGEKAPACCKVCTKGCACGDSCISCDKTFHKEPGCACNAR
jgi:hypothetical protein